jgi:hypothetical protein
MSEKVVTVEVFRDADRQDVSIDAAEAGVDELRRVVTGIEIVRANRLIRVAQPEDPWIVSDNLHPLRQTEADLSIVMTDRWISCGNDWVQGMLSMMTTR